MNLLVTGGAGYIGSHVADLALKEGHQVCVLDNLSKGLKKLVPEKAEFFKGDVGDKDYVSEILQKQKIEAVLHFAAFTEVEESVKEPDKYFENNVNKTKTLIDCCLKNNVDRFIFSSSAAVYGDVKEVPINESAICQPVNPYGQSKLDGEELLKNSGIQFIALRYFNVAGASLDSRRGQAHSKATTLFHLAAKVATEQQDKLLVFGTDYDTKDGSCVRDFIHVLDLGQAHLDALSYLSKGGESQIMNCGYGHGYSVKEVITAFESVLERKLPVEYTDRRPGDIVVSIADNSKIKELLKWQPQYDDLKLICKTTYDWEVKHASTLC